MSTKNLESQTPLTRKQELVDFLETGKRPTSEWRIGTEHEKFGFRKTDLQPIPYEGPQGIAAVLEKLQGFGWAPIKEEEKVIGLTHNGQSITLEPGGQLELSGAPVRTLHQTCDEVHTHLSQVRSVADDLNIAFIGTGFHPTCKLEDIPMMPKGRYEIMRKYMPKRGSRGLDMMFRTCTVQVNLDFDSEADMVQKFRVGLALQPIATALYANSPFTEGLPNGFLSMRSHIWTDTDPDRTGMLPFVFEQGMGFERYADYALNVPMYFVYRNGIYIDTAGESFVEFMDGKLNALPGERPLLSDWEDHLTTIFPEVRLKRFLEMRGADGGPWRNLCALPAFWVGLLYDRTALDAAWNLVKNWTPEERHLLREQVPRYALKTQFRKHTVADLGREVLNIAQCGLKLRAKNIGLDEDESAFLDALFNIIESGLTPAEEHLEAFHNRWKKSVYPLFTETAY